MLTVGQVLVGLAALSGARRSPIEWPLPPLHLPPSPPARRVLARPTGWPIEGRVSSHYGMRHHPILMKRVLHAGIDLVARRGTPVATTAPGTVVAAEWRGGYGNVVVVAHDDGLETLYAHLDALWVREGDELDRGDPVGPLGATGRVTGAHVHYEVRRHGQAEDPRGWQ